MYLSSRVRLGWVLLGVLLASGCGGGGGGGVARVALELTQEQQLTQEYAGHAEYGRQWGLVAVNAAPAYARLEARYGAGVVPGEGVTVAVIDSGIDQASWGFESTRITETLLSGAAEEDGSESSHGTSVAGVIAALRDGPIPQGALPVNDVCETGLLLDQGECKLPSVHGLAWGATLDAYGIPLGSGDPFRYEPVSLAELASADAFWSSVFAAGLSKRPHVLNLSLNYEGLIEQYSEADLRDNFDQAIAVLVQAGRTDKTIIAVAGGNAENDLCSAGYWCVAGTVDARVPELFPGLPMRIEKLRSHYVAVVATDEDGDIAFFSNRCGIAAKWCIAAPGENILTLYHGPANINAVNIGERGYRRRNGTSFAAPHVAGGIALLAHLFRDQMPNTKLLQRLYATATVTPDSVSPGESCPAHLDTDGDFSSCELSSTHGRGLMNLGAASSPVGSVSFDGASVKTSRLYTSAAMGDALASLAEHKVTIFDSLNAPFWERLGNFVAPVTTGGLGSQVASVATGRQSSQAAFGPAAPGSALAWMDMRASHLSLATGGLRLSHASEKFALSAFATPAESSSPVQGATLVWHLDDVVRIGTGWMQERSSLLNATADGAFGDLAATTTFMAMGATFNAGDWEINADAELGTVAPTTSGILDLSSLRTSAFSLSAHKGGLRFSLEQPLRVEHGVADLRLPDGRTKEGELVYQDVRTSLAPSGRQLDLSVAWERPLTIGAMSLGATFSRHPHHTRTGTDSTLLAGYRLQF